MFLTKEGELNGSSTCLWEAIVHMANDVNYPNATAYEELQRRLGQSACLSWQEIGISPSPEGWIIHIRACNESGKVDILIPKNRKTPVKILQDTRDNSSDYRGYE